MMSRLCRGVVGCHRSTSCWDCASAATFFTIVIIMFYLLLMFVDWHFC
jgi:diacylglycerol kinase